MVVCPDMSSPAQSFASVMKVPSNSCFPWRAAFCSFCLGSLGASSGSLWQQTNVHARHTSTTVSPARNVMMDDRRKHHHFRTLRHAVTSSGSDVEDVSSSDEAIPRWREASSQARHARAAMRAPRTAERDWAARRCRRRSMPRDRSPPRRAAALALPTRNLPHSSPHYSPSSPPLRPALYSSKLSARDDTTPFTTADVVIDAITGPTPYIPSVADAREQRTRIKNAVDFDKGQCIPPVAR